MPPKAHCQAFFKIRPSCREVYRKDTILAMRAWMHRVGEVESRRLGCVLWWFFFLLSWGFGFGFRFCCLWFWGFGSWVGKFWAKARWCPLSLWLEVLFCLYNYITMVLSGFIIFLYHALWWLYHNFGCRIMIYSGGNRGLLFMFPLTQASGSTWYICHTRRAKFWRSTAATTALTTTSNKRSLRDARRSKQEWD